MRGNTKKRVSSQSPAQGWIATAKFGKGGTKAQDSRFTLTVHALNPERGTDWSIPGRLELLKRALNTVGVCHEQTIYLTTAGWFGCETAEGNASNGISWFSFSKHEEDSLKKALCLIAKELPPSTHMAIGVDRSGDANNQELWWFQGGDSNVKAVHVRTDKPTPRAIGDFRVLAFICGAIYGFAGPALDFRSDLNGVDVVLNAGHASLNRQRNPRIRLDQKRWAFHRSIRTIGRKCGAVFSHAHGSNYDAYVRNCDNWIVYRNKEPFRGERKGVRINNMTLPSGVDNQGLKVPNKIPA